MKLQGGRNYRFRQQSALERLQKQLTTNTKRQKNSDGGQLVALTPEDVNRINGEIAILLKNING